MNDSVKLCICSACTSKIKRIPSERCPVCGLVTPLGSSVCWNCASKTIYFKSHKSPYFYEDDVRRAVIRFKFYGKTHYADAMGTVMAAYIPFGVNIDYITWVPMTKTAIKARGYNQAELLAKTVSEYSNAQCIELLYKKRTVKRQSSLKASERIKNVKGIFGCTHDLHGKNILLVDDIYTTGATMNECSKILKKHGANEVYCITFASTKVKK